MTRLDAASVNDFNNAIVEWPPPCSTALTSVVAATVGQRDVAGKSALQMLVKPGGHGDGRLLTRGNAAPVRTVLR